MQSPVHDLQETTVRPWEGGGQKAELEKLETTPWVISTPQPFSNSSHSPASLFHTDLCPRLYATQSMVCMVLLQKAFFISGMKLGVKGGGGASFENFSILNPDLSQHYKNKAFV